MSEVGVRRLRFHFVTVVWGEPYVDLFLKVGLPSLLSPNNLPYVAHKTDSVYRIYTTQNDATIIGQSPVFVRLADIMSTEILFMEDGDFESKGFECFRKAIDDVVRDDAGLVFLAADMVWADGAFANLYRIALSGKLCIMIGSFRLAKESFVPALLERYQSLDECTLSVQPRDLVRLSLEHLHPWTKSCLWDSLEFTSWPCWLHWAIGDGGLLLRQFHLQPLLTRPSERLESTIGSLDGSEYVPITHPSYDDIYIVEDSDEIAGFEMSDSKYCVLTVPGNRATAVKIAYWASSRVGGLYPMTNRYHRMFLQHRIRIHADEIKPEWRMVEESSDKTVDMVLSLLRFELVFRIIGLLSPQSVIAMSKRRLYRMIPSSMRPNLLRLYYSLERFPFLWRLFGEPRSNQ
ncbi:MAG: hypothetical protein HQ553_07160 [Chloroflexi bacterium]|nr:hypothetical protein [Chloroflexota bacterium]